MATSHVVMGTQPAVAAHIAMMTSSSSSPSAQISLHCDCGRGPCHTRPLSIKYMLSKPFHVVQSRKGYWNWKRSKNKCEHKEQKIKREGQKDENLCRKEMQGKTCSKIKKQVSKWLQGNASIKMLVLQLWNHLWTVVLGSIHYIWQQFLVINNRDL